MSHYFENDINVKDKPGTIAFEVLNKKFELATNSGVFSKDKLDTGTKILLETVLKNQDPASSILDLGCGIGVVGIVMGTFWNDCALTMIDINEKAVQLAKENIKRHKIPAEVYCNDGIDSGSYECILINPPIRAGKKVVYTLLEQCINHLDDQGTLWVVMRKQHGAQSAMDRMVELGVQVERVHRDKGFWILKVKKK